MNQRFVISGYSPRTKKYKDGKYYYNWKIKRLSFHNNHRAYAEYIHISNVREISIKYSDYQNLEAYYVLIGRKNSCRILNLNRVFVTINLQDTRDKGTIAYMASHFPYVVEENPWIKELI